MLFNISCNFLHESNWLQWFGCYPCSTANRLVLVLSAYSNNNQFVPKKNSSIDTDTKKILTSYSNHVLIVTRDINSFASNQTQIWDKHILMYFLCCTWGFVQALNVFQHLFHRVKSSSHKFILNLLRCCAKRNVLNLDVFWLKCCSPLFLFYFTIIDMPYLFAVSADNS